MSCRQNGHWRKKDGDRISEQASVDEPLFSDAALLCVLNIRYQLAHNWELLVEGALHAEDIELPPNTGPSQRSIATSAITSKSARDTTQATYLKSSATLHTTTKASSLTSSQSCIPRGKPDMTWRSFSHETPHISYKKIAEGSCNPLI